MSRGYVYACQRAELLGLPTLTEAEWLASEEGAREREAEEQEAYDGVVAEELDDNSEGMKRIGGGLDELNSILSVTQKKINKFKTVCGSLGTLLKGRVSSQPGTPEHKSRAGSSSSEQQQQPSTSEQREADETTPVNEEDQEADTEASVAATTTSIDETNKLAMARKADLNSKVGSHLDKLDSLITKAENAQYSMKHQTKQMKTFLK